MSFQISALPQDYFEHLFNLSPEELAAHRALRITATRKPGFPCRISLADAEIGEQVILVNYEHQPADSPYRSNHAVYIRPGAAQAQLKTNEVPELLCSRTLSLRGFDQEGMLTAAEVTDGNALAPAIEAMLANPRAAYLHIHFANAGCYAARVDRA
jgi:hypothetical protein